MDPVLEKLINQEIKRQELTLDLIASENIASPETLRIIGSPLVNKYSEGYPGRRYYPGNVYYDQIEELARANALKAFGLRPGSWSANVQPYSGSPANQAVYFALAKPGDVVMGLALSHGGHLTHGHLVNFSGTLYKSLPYGLNAKTGLIDYRNLAKIAKASRPKIIISGATAYSRKIDFRRIGLIAKQVGAYHVSDISHIAGLVAGGVHPSPFPYAHVVTTTTHKTLRGPRGAVIFARKRKRHDSEFMIHDSINKAVFPGLQGGPHNNVTAAIAWMFQVALTPQFRAYARQIVKNAAYLAKELTKLGFKLVSGGTDNHLMLVDLKNTNVSGIEVEKTLEAAGILANRNTVPGDTTPFKPSGIRIGTPAVTTRGMKEKEMKQIAAFIHDLIIREINPQKVRQQVERLAMRFPIGYKSINNNDH